MLCGIAGVAIWPIYAFGWIDNVASAWHIDMQLQGFLFAFVMGFLTTALPRFTMTWHATFAELLVFVSLFLTGNIATASGNLTIGRVLYASNLTTLLIFAFRRFRKRTGSPPEEFMLLGFGLLIGWIAALIRAAGGFWELPPSWEILARRMISEGMMMMLVLGIGTRLAPLFWGLGSGVSPVIPMSLTAKPTLNRRHLFFGLIGALFLASFVLEPLGIEKVGFWVRAVLASIVFIGPMKILKPAKTKGLIIKTLRWSMLAVALSPWGPVIHSQYRVETLHVMFIAGFGIMILTIATRVILSHGNHPIEIEKRSPALLTGALLFLIAMVFRGVAALDPEHYFTHLAIAGSLWIVGLSIWGIVFSARAVRVRPPVNLST